MTNEPATRAAAARPAVTGQAIYRVAGRTPISQWPRLEAGHSDDLTAGS